MPPRKLTDWLFPNPEPPASLADILFPAKTRTETWDLPSGPVTEVEETGQPTRGVASPPSVYESMPAQASGATQPSPPIDLITRSGQPFTVLLGEPILNEPYSPPQHGTLILTIALDTQETVYYTRNGGATWTAWSSSPQPLSTGATFTLHVYPESAVNIRVGDGSTAGTVTVEDFDLWFTASLLPVTGGVTVGGSVIVSITSVTISGPVTVQGQVDIGTMPDVTINSSSTAPVYVSIAASTTINVTGSVSISGNVDIGTMPDVTINSSSTAPVYVSVTETVDVSITNSTLTVQFPSAQEVTLAATGPVNVENAILPTTDGVNVSGSTAVSGTSGYLFVPVPDAYYDEITLLAYAPNGDLSDYTFEVNQLRYSDPFNAGIAVWAGLNLTLTATGDADKPAYAQEYLGGKFGPYPATTLVLYWTATASVNETLQWQVKAHYATQTVGNPTSNPAQVQTASGAFDSINAPNNNQIPLNGVTGNVSEVVFAINQVVEANITVTFYSGTSGQNGGATLQLQVNGVTVDTVTIPVETSGTYEFQLSFTPPRPVDCSASQIVLLVTPPPAGWTFNSAYVQVTSGYALAPYSTGANPLVTQVT
jgi:hypothetical protein